MPLPLPSQAPLRPITPPALERGHAMQRLLRAAIARLAPLHKEMPPARSGEWLASHKESGQTFGEYADNGAITPTTTRRDLVVQPIGPLSQAHQRVLATVTEYLGAFFGLPTRQEPPLPLALVSPLARRSSRGYGEQLLTPYLLERVLAPRLPGDAMAYLAFTASDLWPGEGWNFVFGQASPSDRVGVWSLVRNGDVEDQRTAQRSLIRAMKIATHETGHMFGIQHCTAYLCNMAGVNHLEESDAHPTWLCPQCLAKVCWATESLPGDHLKRMLAFATAHDLRDEQNFYAESLRLLGA